MPHLVAVNSTGQLPCCVEKCALRSARSQLPIRFPECPGVPLAPRTLAFPSGPFPACSRKPPPRSGCDPPPCFCVSDPVASHGAEGSSLDRSFFVRLKSTLTKRGLHVKTSGYKVGAPSRAAGPAGAHLAAGGGATEPPSFSAGLRPTGCCVAPCR